ncbi:MAG: amino acid kinase family protein [Solirubrobacterales bacterium]
MRILLALGGSSLPAGMGETAPDQRRNVEAIAGALAEIAAGHELLLIHGNAPAGRQALELALRNALPDRDVVSVLAQIVVAPDSSSLEPHAVAEIRSLRVLLGSGALVVCAGENLVPVVLDGLGTMHEVDVKVDLDLTAALLARRLDADLLMMQTDPFHGSAAAEAKADAARRFVEATGRRAVIGSLEEMARSVQSDTLAA